MNRATRFVFNMIVVSSMAPSVYGTASLTCDPARYYESDLIRCLVTLKAESLESRATDVRVQWQILGKTVSSERRMLRVVAATEEFSYKAPQGLRAVTPLRVIATFDLQSHEVAYGRDVQSPLPDLNPRTVKTILVFPRDPKYWTGPKEFDSKTILVEKRAEWIAAELKALQIPYVLDSGNELSALKQVDLRLTAEMLKGYDAKDPWARWSLVQLLRRKLGAKDLD